VSALRWTPLVLVLGAVVSLAVVAVILVGRPMAGNAVPSSSARPSGSLAADTAEPSSTTAIPAPRLEPVAYPGPGFDRNVVTAPTAALTQSKLWFHDGSWWGLLVSARTNHVHIHELHWASQRWVDTGVVVDDRVVPTDVVWDGERLAVVGAGPRNSLSNAMRFARFTYVPDARRYILEPDFPRTLTTSGVGPPTLASGPDGRLWLAYVTGGRVAVRSSEDGGLTWGEPLDPRPPDASASRVEVAAIVATPRGVALTWTLLKADELHVARHEDGDPDDAWTASAVTIDGLRYGEDQLSVRATSDDAVVVVVRTSLDRVENRNLEAPQLVLAELEDGQWSQGVVARVRDDHDRPQLVVDDARGLVHIFAETPDGIYVKTATLEAPSFVTGVGTLVMRPAGGPLATSPSAGPASPADPSASPSGDPLVPRLAGVTTTRQALASLAEIVVVAADDATGHYAHAVIGLPDGRAAPEAAGHAGPLPEGVIEGLPPGATTFLFRDGFSAFATGPATLTGWETREADPDAVVRVVEPSLGDPSLEIIPNQLGVGTRACRDLPSISTGRVVVRATVQALGQPESDATISTLRANGQEVVSVRFGEPGVFRYFSGDVRIDASVAYQAGAWYESILTMDLDSQTYDWQVTPLGADAPILTLTDLPLRISAASVDQLCARSAGAVPGGAVELLVDDVSVAIGPGG
jgi:hypothetical protein